nr:ribonuclease H-like domain-containing protein [Tanacetum cinerariifolium]
MTRRVLLRCDSTGDLYPVTHPSPIPRAFLASQHTWHQRLGHPGGDVLRRLVSNNVISCNNEKPPVPCHACQLGKHVRLPFVNSNTVAISCFEIIYSDVWTSPIPSFSGFKYYVLFLDHYSQFVWVYPLLNTSDVWSKFVLFHTYVRTQLKCEIRSFQCDHGGEFDNRNLHKLFAENGIQFRFSCPKTSQQMANPNECDPNWKNAMRDEYSVVIKNRTWVLVPRPTDTNIVRCMWLFRHKYLADDTLSRYKARLVANGSTQLEGVDVDETFSPVVKPGTIRMVLILAVSRHWPIHQLDVKNAFLHGDLSETVYMHQPPGFRDSKYPDHEFSMTDFSSLYYFLGISVTRGSFEMFLSQKKYVVEILEKAHMVNCNSSRTPVDSESKLGADGDPISDPTLYRSLACSLLYFTFTRPDISYAVQRVCLYMHDSQEPRFSALKRVLRYVRGTQDYGLQLFSSSTTDLVAYSDADWAGCPTTRRSTSEAEYRDVANAVAETCWLRNLLRELHTLLSSATLVYRDNVSAVYLSFNPVQHQRTKHIEIDIHFVRDFVAAGQVRVLHVPSRYQFADIFTKGLPSALFEEFRNSLSVWCPPALTAGEC